MTNVTNHTASPPALEIIDLKFRFPARKDDLPTPGTDRAWLLDIARLTLNTGEQMLLRAPSGRGKSTLLHIIAGIVDLPSGRVNVAGRNIHALTGAERDRFRGAHIGMIFQTFNLLQGFSALENVLAALMCSPIPAKEHEARARALLKSLGIERVDATPDRLSVGQQQRVAVARAVACRPALVLADEPTASLDPENAAAALDLIQRTCRDQGSALLLVSHDPTIVGRFDRVETLAAPSPSTLQEVR